MNRDARSFFLLTALFLLTANALHAQKTNDEFKKNLRKSLVMPELKPDMKFQSIQIQQYEKEVLKVSPDTELPTIFNRIRLLNSLPPEKRIHIEMEVTNSIPINERPRGSVKYEFNGREMQVRSNAGEKVVPSGRDLDPVRAIQRHNAKQRKKKVDKILKAYGQEME